MMKLPVKKYRQDLERYYRIPAVQISLTVVLSLFVVAFFIAFAIRPTLVAIVSLKKTIAESEKSLEQLETKVANLDRAARILEEIEPSLEKLDASITENGADYQGITSDIEILAQQSGVLLDSESFGGTLLFSRLFAPFKASKGQVVVEMPISVRATGSYANISLFLRRLLSMERVIGVESATLTREAGPRTAIASVALNVNGSIYYLADEAQLKKAIPDEKGKR